MKPNFGVVVAVVAVVEVVAIVAVGVVAVGVFMSKEFVPFPK